MPGWYLPPPSASSEHPTRTNGAAPMCLWHETSPSVRCRRTTSAAERDQRAKITNDEGESLAAAALGDASDIMMDHPLALQLRNLQSLVDIGVDKNTTVVFPAPLMSTISELSTFLARESAAAASSDKSRNDAPVATGAVLEVSALPNGTPVASGGTT